MVTDLLLKSHRKKINNHKWVLLSCIDENTQKYENILMGDCRVCWIRFSSKCGKKTLCFKNPPKPTCIHRIITNKPGLFCNAKTSETGLSDFHKLVVGIIKLSYKKTLPFMIKYKDEKKLLN